MSKFEDLVPPPELCKLIPAGKFEDSALVWYRATISGDYVCLPRLYKNVDAARTAAPAPTLAEIMDNLLLETNDCEPTLLWQGGWHIQCAGEKGYDMTSAATAALKLWFLINGVEVGK